MIINENSWHFKIYAAFNSTWNRPKTLCAYFWKTLIPVLAGFNYWICDFSSSHNHWPGNFN